MSSKVRVSVLGGIELDYRSRLTTPDRGQGACPEMPSLVATLGPKHDKPWWWEHLDQDQRLCALQYERLTYRGKHSQKISAFELPLILIKVLVRLVNWRRDYQVVFTFECDLVGFSIAFWQSITGMRRPKHIILQFIMRERQNTLRSRAKYALMRFLFGSVYKVVVSSRAEAEYYPSVFGWRKGKAVFVPFHTAPALIEPGPEVVEDYILAAGRTFRDYATLIEAVADTEIKLVIVGGTGATSDIGAHDNILIMENIPQLELNGLMRGARAVVVPLEDRLISTGQSVLLHAMGLGKPVIATGTAGTVDYVDHLVDGILVPPGDAVALRDALLSLDDELLRTSLGKAARARVLNESMPHHYSAGVRRAISRLS